MRMKRYLSIVVAAAASIALSPISAYANTADFYFERGDKRLDNEDYIGAIADFSRVLESQPNNDAAYHNRGMAKHSQGEYESAISDFTRAINIDPEYAPSYQLRGEANALSENCSSAISDFTTSMKLDPKHSYSYVWRAHCYNSMELYSNAYNDAIKSTSMPNANEDHYIELAIAAANLNKPRQAISAFTKSIKYDQDLAFAYKFRGVAYEEINDMKNACRDWRTASKLGDEDATLWTRDQCSSDTGLTTNNQPKPTLRGTLSDTPFQWK